MNGYLFRDFSVQLINDGTGEEYKRGLRHQALRCLQIIEEASEDCNTSLKDIVDDSIVNLTSMQYGESASQDSDDLAVYLVLVNNNVCKLYQCKRVYHSFTVIEYI